MTRSETGHSILGQTKRRVVDCKGGTLTDYHEQDDIDQKLMEIMDDTGAGRRGRKQIVKTNAKPHSDKQ